ncbi:MAG TPA: metallophosphoesterase [Bryobacteraceae bacterium]|nr:metallophosphoesterase [Bryobacteraceae bacterium]
MALIASAAFITFSIVFSSNRLANLLAPGNWHEWARGIGHLWGLTFLGTAAGLFALPLAGRQFSPARRQFLNAAGGALVASPAIIVGYGVFGRNQFQVKEIDIPIPGLPKDLQGLRILQLSDIHMSAFLTEADLRRVVDMANETKPHLCVLTGDLITGRNDPLELCMKHVSRVRADAGIIGCNGNHEIFADCEARVKARGSSLGMNILRGEKTRLRFGSATLNVVGVDYQPFRSPYLIGAGELVEPDAVNLLLSHNPDVFPVAARQGYQLTLAGHTHGGQVTVEILHQYANVARMFTNYVYGRYHQNGAALYVTRGIGTVGIPARVGAPPEITVVRLCAS